MSNKKKTIRNVVIIAATDFPFNSSVANLLRNLAMGFQEHGKMVHFFLLRGNMGNRQPEFCKRKNNYKGITFTYTSFLKHPNNYLLKIVELLISIITTPVLIVWRKIKGNIDAVIIYTGYAYQNLPIVITCKLMRIPVYKYSVDYYNKESIVRKWWMLPKWWMFIVEISFFDKFLNGIIAISKLLYNHYKNIGINEGKLILIPNIININDFSDKTIIKKNNILRIGYCGAAPLLNGVDDLIRAFKIIKKKHKNTELLVVGDVVGNGSQLPKLKEIAKDNSIAKHINFKGRVPGRDVPRYLASCDILVLARKNTQYAQAGFPTKLGEYFASGKPVVMTSVGDITAYFKDKEHLVIAEPDNPESLAESINFIIENPDRSEKISKNGFLWAKENLDFLKTSKKIHQFMLSNQYEVKNTK